MRNDAKFLWRHGAYDVVMDVSRHSGISSTHYLDSKTDKKLNMESLKQLYHQLEIFAEHPFFR